MIGTLTLPSCREQRLTGTRSPLQACKLLSDDYEQVRSAAVQLIWVVSQLYPERSVGASLPLSVAGPFLPPSTTQKLPSEKWEIEGAGTGLDHRLLCTVCCVKDANSFGSLLLICH